MFAVAFSFGAVSSIYWAFAIDHVSRASGAEAVPLGLPLGPLFFVVVGLGGTAGLSAGDAMGAFGLRRVLAGVLLCAALAASLLGVATDRSRCASCGRGGRCLVNLLEASLRRFESCSRTGPS